jgi:hypothetical protein
MTNITTSQASNTTKMSETFCKRQVTSEINKILGIELRNSVSQLLEELFEAALKTPRGTSLPMEKLKVGKVVPLLTEFEAALRTTRDELRFEREMADKLAELLRGTTRALIDAPGESMQMILRRLPPTFGAMLT